MVGDYTNGNIGAASRIRDDFESELVVAMQFDEESELPYSISGIVAIIHKNN